MYVIIHDAIQHNALRRPPSSDLLSITIPLVSLATVVALRARIKDLPIAYNSECGAGRRPRGCPTL